jgi:hypothetical protein
MPALGTLAYGAPGVDLPDLLRQPAYYPIAPTQAEQLCIRLRVSVMVEADGTVRLKVTADDRLVVETSGRGTITVESEVGR